MARSTELPLSVNTEIDPLDTHPDDLETRIAQQLPVISPQRNSLAAVMLTRWLCRMVPYGLARLEVVRHRGHDTWSLSWHTPKHQAKTLTATTLAELLVRLLAEESPEAHTGWADGMMAPGTAEAVCRRSPRR